MSKMPGPRAHTAPLAGCKVIDFSNLLPGPFATRLLADAGAEIVKVERPGVGDELRAGTPVWGDTSLSFALLNTGKKSVAIDLKNEAERERLLPLIQEADILIEQFRPGVMDRLGLGYETLSRLNPRIVYCSITGYGQQGPSAQVAGHDLTYMAETGLLSLAADSSGAPTLPPVLVGDIGAGSLPAIINILLALRYRDTHGEGSWLDISITDNLFAFPYWAVARGEAFQQWPQTGGERLTGGSPRYQIYRTLDDRFIAAAPLEQRFWKTFCQAIGLAEDLYDDAKQPERTRAAVAEIIRGHDSGHWRGVFEGQDVCAVVVNTMQEAANHEHFRGRGLFDRKLKDGERAAPDMKLPLAPFFERPSENRRWPALGENNHLLHQPLLAKQNVQ